MDNIETTASDEVTIKNLVKELAEDYSDFFKVDTSEVVSLCISAYLCKWFVINHYN